MAVSGRTLKCLVLGGVFMAVITLTIGLVMYALTSQNPANDTVALAFAISGGVAAALFLGCSGIIVQVRLLQLRRRHARPARETSPLVPDAAPNAAPDAADVADSQQPAEFDEDDPRMCQICFEYAKNCALQCGHVFCSKCATSVAACPVCRVPITGRQMIYL